MGKVRKVLFQTECDKPMLNKRLTVELCENVHLHYRNLRLEFPKEEFLEIVKVIKGLDEEEIENFEYGKKNFKSLFKGSVLPAEAEFDNRLVLEEQAGGKPGTTGYHLHYRNLRIEYRIEYDL